MFKLKIKPSVKLYHWLSLSFVLLSIGCGVGIWVETSRYQRDLDNAVERIDNNRAYPCEVRRHD